MESKAAHWRAHYQRRHHDVGVIGLARSVELTNERVQMQLYAHVLEGVGGAFGKSILDVGCGWGSMTLMLHACGARVTGVDIVPETMATLQARHPEIAWNVVDLGNEAQMRALPAFDCVVATEVLEHVEFDTGMRSLWAHVRPGGRLVATVPNSDCPILRRGRQRWGDDQYFSEIFPADIQWAAASLPDVERCVMKSLSFRQDQSFLPYRDSDWSEVVDGTPNRIIFVLVRCSTDMPAEGGFAL
jgi:cyclopropane fatty-acyl-phospholipid synthase-like methyltransferase